MAIKAQTRRILSLARTFFIITLVLAAVTTAALWFTLQYKPSWYRQAIVERMSPRRARAEAIQLVDTISDSLAARQSTDIVMTNRGVTGWLATMPSLLQQSEYSLPEGVSALAVRFDEAGFMQIGARVDQEGLRAIVSVSIRIELVKQGKYIRVALDQANGGALPLPKSVIEKLLNPILHSKFESRTKTNSQRLQEEAKFEMARNVDELFEGVLIPNRFVWPNGDRPFKIDAIKFSQSLLTLHIRPMP